MVALHDGREFVGQGAKDLRALSADPAVRLNRNVALFYECKNEIGTSRTYANAPEHYRSPTEIAARILAYMTGSALAAWLKRNSLRNSRGGSCSMRRPSGTCSVMKEIPFDPPHPNPLPAGEGTKET
jgi:hypothetical protein